MYRPLSIAMVQPRVPPKTWVVSFPIARVCCMPTKEELTTSIAAVGDEIRVLKSEKADVKLITERVALLKKLKVRLLRCHRDRE